MDEPVLVRGVERRGDLPDDRDRALGSDRSFAAAERPEVGALDEPHGDVDLAVGLTGLVHGDDVRVVDRRGEPRLARDAIAKGLVAGESWREDLERDGPVEPHVVRAVDPARPAAAHELLDPIPGNLGGREGVVARRHDARPIRASMIVVATSTAVTARASRHRGGRTRRTTHTVAVTSPGRSLALPSRAALFVV
jgi:hypothetical protein